jgi:hypothetical protein
MHLCKFGFMLGYDVWTHHGETIHQRTTSVVEDEDDRSGDDRMDEMLDAIRQQLEKTVRILLHRRCKSFLTSLKLQKSRCMNT